MSPPQAPGIPGTNLPVALEARVLELENRVAALETARARAQLQSITDEEEDSKVTIPSDAPPKVKAALGALSGLTPTGRAVVLVVLGLAAIAGIVLLVLRGVLKI